MITKVCGLCQAENVQAVAETGIQWMGFIFYAPSLRCLLRDPAEAERVRQLIIADTFRPKRVGVFVNQSQEEILALAQAYGLDYLQLHGHESPDFCYALHKRGYALIKAFSIATAEDLAHTAIGWIISSSTPSAQAMAALANGSIGISCKAIRVRPPSC